MRGAGHACGQNPRRVGCVFPFFIFHLFASRRNRCLHHSTCPRASSSPPPPPHSPPRPRSPSSPSPSARSTLHTQTSTPTPLTTFSPVPSSLTPALPNNNNNSNSNLYRQHSEAVCSSGSTYPSRPHTAVSSSRRVSRPTRAVVKTILGRFLFLLRHLLHL